MILHVVLLNPTSGREVPVPLVHGSEALPRGCTNRHHHRERGAERRSVTCTQIRNAQQHRAVIKMISYRQLPHGARRSLQYVHGTQEEQDQDSSGDVQKPHDPPQLHSRQGIIASHQQNDLLMF